MELTELTCFLPRRTRTLCVFPLAQWPISAGFKLHAVLSRTTAIRSAWARLTSGGATYSNSLHPLLPAGLTTLSREVAKATITSPLTKDTGTVPAQALVFAPPRAIMELVAAASAKTTTRDLHSVLVLTDADGHDLSP